MDDYRYRGPGPDPGRPAKPTSRTNGRLHRSRVTVLASLAVGLLAAVLVTAGASASGSRDAATSRVTAGDCNTNKIVVTYYSEPSILDFQQFGTDGDNDVRANLVGTLLSRKFVPGTSPNTTNGVTGQYTGNVASSWSLNKATNALTFHLRPGIKFSDGTPVTSADVKFSFVRGLKDPLSYLPSVMKMLTITSTSQITTPNSSTVVFHFKKFNPFTYELMSIWATGIVSEKAVKAHATAKDPWANAWLKNNMVSTGPYKLGNATPGVEYDFVPNPYYWDKANYPCNGGIAVKVTPNASDRLALIEKGGVDVARSLDYSAIAGLEKNSNLQVLKYTTADMRELGLNVNVKPFNNQLVRQAIAYAIPYKQILAANYAGLASPLNSIVPPNMPTTDPKSWPYSTNLTKAKQLLAKAGLAKGFSTTLFTRSGDSEDQKAAVLIQASLAKIGVRVTIQSMLTAAYAARQFNQRDMPMFFWNWISFTNDPYYDFTFLAQCKQGTNYANFCSPTVDSLIAKGMYEQNAAKRAAISRQIQKLVAQGAAHIGLGTPDSVVVMAKDVHGWNQQVDLNARYYTLWKS
jgi:peptide/nickel transport system substrate-binding protein